MINYNFFFYIISYTYFLYTLFKVSNDSSEKNVKLIKSSANRCGPLAIKLLQFIKASTPGFISGESLNFVFEDNFVHEFNETENIYLRDFKMSIHGSYSNFEVIGSGSIGQVYKCYCKTRQQFVALKVKHPQINKIVNETVYALRIACWLLRPFNKFDSICREYINNIFLQIDYIKEVENTKRLRHNFRNETVIVVPEIYNYTENIIIMSYHEATNYSKLNEHEKLLASMYMNFMFLTSIIIHDFLHSDLHQGNWKVIRENNDIKILMYDCGIMSSTGNYNVNYEIVNVVTSGKSNHINVLEILKMCDKQFDIEKYRPEIMSILNRYDERESFLCFSSVIRRLVDLRLIKDPNLINMLTSIAVLGDTPAKSINVIIRHIIYPAGTNALLFHIYIGLLTKMNRFLELRNYLIDYLNKDKFKQNLFSDWLFEEFGHRKGHILTDVIYKQFFPENDDNQI